MNEKNAKKLLFAVADVLEDIGVEFFLWAGTLLGAVREKKFIEIDADIDLGMLSEIFKPVAKIVEERLIKKGLRIERIDHRHKGSWDGSRYAIKFYGFGEHGDLCGYKKYKNKRIIPSHVGPHWCVHSAQYLEELKEIEFYGRSFKISKDADGALAEIYGDWQIPDKKASDCKRLIRRSELWVENLKREADAVICKGQVLITGCYRSGTEYITYLINNHSAIEVGMYVTDFMRFYYNRYGNVGNRTNYIKLINDATVIIKKRYGGALNKGLIISKCDAREVVTYGFIYDQFMINLLLEGRGVNIWGEKTQLAWTKIPDFLNMFPKGKAIMVIRDPRSVLASFKKWTNAPSPLYLGAVFNCLGAMMHAKKYSELYPKRFCLVRHEDVARDYRHCLKEIWKFLGLNYREDFANNRNWQNVDGTRWLHNSAFGEDSFDINATIHRWKDNLEQWEISFCEEVNKEYMLLYNYEASSSVALNQGALRLKINNQAIDKYISNWKNTGEGIEEFPSNPLDSKNWGFRRLRDD